MLIIPFRVLMRLKLNEMMHVKCSVECLAFIKCTVNASDSNSDVQVPVRRSRLCLWVPRTSVSVVHLWWGLRKGFCVGRDQ